MDKTKEQLQKQVIHELKKRGIKAVPRTTPLPHQLTPRTGLIVKG